MLVRFLSIAFGPSSFVFLRRIITLRLAIPLRIHSPYSSADVLYVSAVRRRTLSPLVTCRVVYMGVCPCPPSHCRLKLLQV